MHLLRRHDRSHTVTLVVRRDPLAWPTERIDRMGTDDTPVEVTESNTVRVGANAAPSGFGQRPLATTYAIASESVCVIERCQRTTPTASANCAAAPDTTSAGSPDARRVTHAS